YLGAGDERIVFTCLYGAAINGMSGYEPNELTESCDPVFDTILERIPAPVDNSEEPLQFQVTLLGYNNYVGRVGIVHVFRGKIKIGDQVVVMKTNGTHKKFIITKLFGFIGLERTDIKEA